MDGPASAVKPGDFEVWDNVRAALTKAGVKP